MSRFPIRHLLLGCLCLMFGSSTGCSYTVTAVCKTCEGEQLFVDTGCDTYEMENKLTTICQDYHKGEIIDIGVSAYVLDAGCLRSGSMMDPFMSLGGVARATQSMVSFWLGWSGTVETAAATIPCPGTEILIHVSNSESFDVSLQVDGKSVADGTIASKSSKDFLVRVEDTQNFTIRLLRGTAIYFTRTVTEGVDPATQQVDISLLGGTVYFSVNPRTAVVPASQPAPARRLEPIPDPKFTPGAR